MHIMVRPHHFQLLASCVVLAFVMALGTQQTRAQVTVNAPSGILNRSGKKDNTKEKSREKTQRKTQKGDAAQSQAGGTSSSTEKPATVSPSGESRGREDGLLIEPSHEGCRTNPRERASQTVSQADRERYRISSQRIETKVTGYRVQMVFSSAKGARGTCCKRAKEIAYKFPHYRTYVSYNAPQWRLRIGDFKQREYARRAMHKLRRAFPKYASGMIIVTDKINVWE